MEDTYGSIQIPAIDELPDRSLAVVMNKPGSELLVELSQDVLEYLSKALVLQCDTVGVEKKKRERESELEGFPQVCLQQRRGKEVLRARRIDGAGKQREKFLRLDSWGSTANAAQMAMRWQSGEDIDEEPTQNFDADVSHLRDGTEGAEGTSYA